MLALSRGVYERPVVDFNSSRAGRGQATVTNPVGTDMFCALYNNSALAVMLYVYRVQYEIPIPGVQTTVIYPKFGATGVVAGSVSAFTLGDPVPPAQMMTGGDTLNLQEAMYASPPGRNHDVLENQGEALFVIPPGWQLRVQSNLNPGGANTVTIDFWW